MKNWLLATALMSLSGVAVANVKVVKEGPIDVADGTSDGKWCSRFKLPGPVSPDAIRVTLPAGTVELYEIEVFK